MLPPLVVVGHEHRFLTQNQIAELGLKPEVRQLFLRDNAIRLFGIRE